MIEIGPTVDYTTEDDDIGISKSDLVLRTGSRSRSMVAISGEGCVPWKSHLWMLLQQTAPGVMPSRFSNALTNCQNTLRLRPIPKLNLSR